MKKLLILLIVIIAIIAIITGCQQAPPHNAFYTQSGSVEMCSVYTDSNYGSDAVKYVRVEVTFINNTNEDLLISSKNFICAYGEAPMEVFKELSFQDKTLKAHRSSCEVIYFKIPIDIENIQIQYTNPSGIGLFNYSV